MVSVTPKYMNKEEINYFTTEVTSSRSRVIDLKQMVTTGSVCSVKRDVNT
jgi:hypothetical protein